MICCLTTVIFVNNNLNLSVISDLDAEAKALKNVLNTHETTELKLECLIRKYVELVSVYFTSETVLIAGVYCNGV